MKARDVMVTSVITVKPDTSIQEVAQTFVDRHISGAPVLDGQGRLIGIVSEGDLLHRSEAGTQRKRSWWLHWLTRRETLASDYVKEHAQHVVDVMSRDVVTASPDTPLREIARTLERNRIKRVPIVENGKVVGIVSRANLVQAVASAANAPAMNVSDAGIRAKLIEHLEKQPWADGSLVNITVADGIVGLWGIVNSETERRALRVAAEGMPSVNAVDDHLVMRPFGT
jgi:CBS domain-containing protein